ncbi:site-specific integrase [Urechidicola croceus]|nr:site-specific integrase [Urechidicola croceus]
MASITFLIRNKKTLNQTPISVKVLWPHRNELVYSTGIKIAPQNWDSKNQKVRNKVEVASVKDLINVELSKIRTFTEQSYSDLKFNGELTKDNLKYKLDLYFNKVSETKKVETFYDYVENILVENAKNRVAKVTWKSYLRTLDLVKAFEVNEKYKISFEKINIDFYYRFIQYLEEIFEMSTNTIGKQIKNIKMFMNSANDDGYTICIGHKHKHFKVLKVESFQVYLNEDELNEIYKLDYEIDSVEDRVRDLFLMGAYTGQRISDWKKLNEDNIVECNGFSCFKIIQTKTKAEVVIPIHPNIQLIFDKRKGKAPKFVNEQDINEKLKQIASRAEIKQKIKEKGNIHKYELVSSHTARRSFCSNAYKAGMDSLAIMQLSGHKTEKNFLTYIKIGNEEFASRIANHKFFKV